LEETLTAGMSLLMATSILLAGVTYAVSVWCRVWWQWLDAFDQWCLQRILRISWRARISNEEDHRHTDQPPLTHIIRTTRLKFFGHTAHADPFCGPQSSPLGLFGPFVKGLEPPIRPTASHVAPDCWIHFSITHHWSAICLSLSAESSSVKHARRKASSSTGQATRWCWRVELIAD